MQKVETGETFLYNIGMSCPTPRGKIPRMRTLPAIFTLLVLLFSSNSVWGIERVYLKSGSTLVALSHKDLDSHVEVTLQSGTKIGILAKDLDKITVETSAPISLSEMPFDGESVLPDVSDPLNEKWLDRPAPENNVSARVYLPFAQQLERGFEIPLASSLSDINLARKKRVKVLEFVGREFYLGMDMQYHEEPGINFDEACRQLFELETARSTRTVLDYIHRLRNSSLDPRKEHLIADAIRLRDRLDPDYGRREISRMESWTAQAAPPSSNYFLPSQ